MYLTEEINSQHVGSKCWRKGVGDTVGAILSRVTGGVCGRGVHTTNSLLTPERKRVQVPKSLRLGKMSLCALWKSKWFPSKVNMPMQ